MYLDTVSSSYRWENLFDRSGRSRSTNRGPENKVTAWTGSKYTPDRPHHVTPLRNMISLQSGFCVGWHKRINSWPSNCFSWDYLANDQWVIKQVTVLNSVIKMILLSASIVSMFSANQFWLFGTYNMLSLTFTALFLEHRNIHWWSVRHFSLIKTFDLTPSL